MVPQGDFDDDGSGGGISSGGGGGGSDSSSSARAGGGSSGDADPSETVASAAMAVAQVSGETFKLVYTCKRCDTRNMIEVKRVSWNEGVVIATCQGCNVKHLIADNTGLLDTGGFTNFTNAVDELKNRGEAVNRVHLEEAAEGGSGTRLSDFDLTVDDNGNVQLMPRPGDKNVVRKEKVSAVGPAVDPSLIVDDMVGVPRTASLGSVGVEGGGAAAGGGGMEQLGSARMDSYAGGGAMVVDVPAGVEPGDLLQLSLGGGGGDDEASGGGESMSGQIMMLRVPEGTEPGGKVEILGAIEFMVPAGKSEGDVLLLETPDGDEVPIALPRGVSEGSFLQVAYPAVPCGEAGAVVEE